MEDKTGSLSWKEQDILGGGGLQSSSAITTQIRQAWYTAHCFNTSALEAEGGRFLVSPSQPSLHINFQAVWGQQRETLSQKKKEIDPESGGAVICVSCWSLQPLAVGPDTA